MADKSMQASISAEFEEAISRQSLNSGENITLLFGKIKKWLTDLEPIAFSGDYSDLSNTPTIPSVGDGTITIKQAGTVIGSFTTNQSDDTTLEFTNTDTKVTSTTINPASAISYYPTLVKEASNSEVFINDGLKYAILQGTASANGFGKLRLGNATAKGTVGNKYGQIDIYSTSTGYGYITQASTGSNLNHILPATAGTILNTGTTSFTQTLTSGTKIGAIKINGTSKDIYIPVSLKNPTALTVKGNGTTSFTYDGSAAKALNIKAGSNVKVVSDTSGNITISATDTTYDSLKNPYALTLQFNGTTNKTYDGSSAQTLNITPSAIGAATSSHTHKTLTLNGDSYDGSSDVNVDLLPFVSGTQTAVTGSWTGNAPSISALFDGLTIRYWLPYNGNGNATLNLTLKNGSTTGAVACYYGGTSRLTTHYKAGNIITLTYRKNVSISGSSTKYTGWWADANYNTNTTYTGFSGATSSADGTSGLVPAPSSGNGINMYLKGDGTWAIPKEFLDSVYISDEKLYVSHYQSTTLSYDLNYLPLSGGNITGVTTLDNNVSLSSKLASGSSSQNLIRLNASNHVVIGASGQSGKSFIYGVYNNTSSGTVYNVQVNSAGQLSRASSSRRTKENINYDIDTESYHNKLMQFKTAEFSLIGCPDRKLGMIAEDVADISSIAAVYDDEPVYDNEENVIGYRKTGLVNNYDDRAIIQMLVIEAQRKDVEIQELKLLINELKDIISR